MLVVAAVLLDLLLRVAVVVGVLAVFLPELVYLYYLDKRVRLLLVVVGQEEHHHQAITVTLEVMAQTLVYFLQHQEQMFFLLGHTVAALVLEDHLQVLVNPVVLEEAVIVRVQQQERAYILVPLS